MMQKMRRYVKVFSSMNEMEGSEKSDSTKDVPVRERQNTGKRKAQAGWEMIRNSALGLEMEQEEPMDIQDIRYV